MFYIFPRIVDKVTCERLTKELLKETKFQEALVINQGESDIYDKPGDEERDRQDHNTRKTDIKFLSDKTRLEKEVNEIVWHYLREANNLMFQYDLTYFQAVQFARYRDGGFYDWHQDTPGWNQLAGEIRKLSLTLCLTDPEEYEGGNLEFWNGFRKRKEIKLTTGKVMTDEEMEKDIRDQGTVIVFDSRDWHRVTPVTKGTRYSIVCWSIGPNFV